MPRKDDTAVAPTTRNYSFGDQMLRLMKYTMRSQDGSPLVALEGDAAEAADTHIILLARTYPRYISCSWNNVVMFDALSFVSKQELLDTRHSSCG